MEFHTLTSNPHSVVDRRKVWMTTPCTGCLEGFFEAKKGIKNSMESENSISKFCNSKSVIKFELLLGQ